MKFIIRHLQLLTIAAVLAAGTAAAITGNPWAAIVPGVLAVLAYAWIAGRYSWLTAARFRADPARPSLTAQPLLADEPYCALRVKPGDELALRLNGPEPKTRSVLVTLMHGQYRGAAHLQLADDSPLALALMKKAAFTSEVLKCGVEDGKFVLRIRIQAKNPADDALIA